MKCNPVSPDKIWAEPDDQGATILNSIRGAQYSVDISIYELGDDNIVAALQMAKQNGVNIRIMFNGQFFVPSNSNKFDQQYAVIKLLNEAPGNGDVEFHWSSNNFNLTHQKTIIIDAHNSDGILFNVSQLPGTAEILVLTNNLNAYGWETQAGSTQPQPLQFWGNGYPKNGKGTRDFGVSIRTPGLVARVAKVFDSDFSCADSGNTNGLKDSRDGLVWSNGTTGISPALPGYYPADGAYPNYSDIGNFPDAVDQGNAREAHIDIIKGATQTLIVYNEEMNDNQIVQCLVHAAKRGVNLRVLMTGSTTSTGGKTKYNYADNFDDLVNAGAQVRLFPNTKDFMYIHAKVISADAGTDKAAAFMGSQNISGNSLNFNRELGIILAGQDTSHFSKVFETDWSTEGLIDWKVESGYEPSGPDYHYKRYKGEGEGEAFIPPMPCGTIIPPD